MESAFVYWDVVGFLGEFASVGIDGFLFLLSLRVMVDGVDALQLCVVARLS